MHFALGVGWWVWQPARAFRAQNHQRNFSGVVWVLWICAYQSAFAYNSLIYHLKNMHHVCIAIACYLLPWNGGWMNWQTHCSSMMWQKFRHAKPWIHLCLEIVLLVLKENCYISPYTLTRVRSGAYIPRIFRDLIIAPSLEHTHTHLPKIHMLPWYAKQVSYL